MIEKIRRMKLAYSVYNLFHKKQLQHNIPLFKKYGIKKSYFSPISSKDFKGLPLQQLPPASEEALTHTQLYKSTSSENQQSILAFNENGYLILRNFLTPEKADAVNHEIEKLLEEKTVRFRYRNKIMFAIHHSALLRSIAEDRQLTPFLNTLLGGEATAFQSINFIMGSEQHTHSDSIHMTTYPLGGLLGVWIALDDITEENGPLHYYPGSHKLPYYLNSDYDNEGSSLLIGKQSYAAYEEMIEGKIKALGIKKEVFTAKKGDVLVWHANLFHGGEPHKDKSKTRRSMVLHYFKKDAICYHEITQRPALINHSD
jgi:phytanoyl-CoA hydroxylase